VTGITDAVAVSAGDNFTCAVLATNGRVKCWGDDFWGELGDSQGVYVQPYGNCLCSPTPVTVAGVGGATTVSAGGGPPAGGQHACATLGNGLIECWGDDSRGQLGNGIATSVCEPGVTCAQTHLFECIPLVVGCPVVNATSTATPALRNAAQVATGSFDSCGLRATGTIGCWGANNAGQLGNGQTADSSTPVAVTGITDAKAITAERDTSCALRAGGRVACWGANDSGQLGIGTTAGPQVCGQAPRVACSTVPVAVSGLADATAIDAGGLVENDHVCAAEASGGVVCWGANSEGQLGDGTTTASSAPVTVTGLP
jgi:alpha-tubulin suppressor-like RCC1 family protein